MDLRLSGQVFCRIKVGATNLDFRSYKNHFYPVLNGSQLYEPKTQANFTENILPIAGILTATLVKKAESSSQILYEEASPYAGMLNQFVQNLEKDLGVKVQVLTVVPDEIQNNYPNDFIKLAKSNPGLIAEYRNTILAASRNVQDCVELAEALLNTNFPKTMWGVQGVQKVLAKVGDGLEKMAPALEQLEASVEHSDTRLRQLHRGLVSGADLRGWQALTELVGDFVKIKGLLANMAQVLYQLCDIDRVFKKQTGYPTTWFFNSSTFYDFIYCFENLLNDLIKMAAAESSTIDPLFAWINTGDKKCQTI